MTKEYTSEEIEEIFWGDSYKEVTSEEIVDQDRWSTYYEQVFEKDGKFFKATWGRGSTEMQDNGIEGFELHEVEKKEKVVTVYE